MTQWRVWACLIGIILFGMFLRVAYLMELAADPAFAFPGVDAGYNDAWARAIVTGDWNAQRTHDVTGIPSTPFFRPPGYAYFLGGIYKLHQGYLAPRIAQALLGLISVFIVFLLARKWFGPATGLLSALFAACYWGFIYFEGELLEPALLVFLGLLIVYALSLMIDKVTFFRAAVAGILIGLFALVRPNILALVPLFMGWVGWILRGRKARAFAMCCAGMLIGLALTVAPVTIRNYMVSGERVLISSNAGINLFIGNNENADGLFISRIQDLGLFRTSSQYVEIKVALERQAGRKMSYSEMSRYFAGKAVSFMTSHPVSALKLFVRKALLLFGPVEAGHNRSIYYDREFSCVLRSIPLAFPFALSSGLLGILLLLIKGKEGSGADVNYRRSLQFGWLMVIFAAGYLISFLPFFVSGQYRIPVIPFLLILGAYGLVCLWNWSKARMTGRVVLGVLIWIGIYISASVNISGYEPNLAKWHVDQAAGWIRNGDYDRAVLECRKAIAVNSGSAEAYVAMAKALGGNGKWLEAESVFREALRMRPDADRARVNLGNLLLRQGRVDEAIVEYKAALDANPGLAEVYLNLGAVLLMSGRAGESESYLREAVKIAPDNARAHLFLSRVLAESGRSDEAAQHYEEAIRLNPDVVRGVPGNQKDE